MRYKLLTVGLSITAYLFGTLFGYRAAVVDYVENDAETIKSIADTMYEEPDVRVVREEDTDSTEGAETMNDDSFDDDSHTSAFQ